MVEAIFLTEWKLEVSLGDRGSALMIISFILDLNWCIVKGLVSSFINNWSGRGTLLSSHMDDVISKYCWRLYIGQIILFSANFGMIMSSGLNIAVAFFLMNLLLGLRIIEESLNKDLD